MTYDTIIAFIMKDSKVFWILVMLLVLAAVTAEECQSGWFGTNCQYKCHCSRSCDDKGNCPQGSKCIKGWFGPACQYVDLTTKESESPTPSWLSGGDDSRCNSNQHTEEVSVYLTQPFPFTWLRVYVQDSALLYNFTVDFDDNVPCNNTRTAKVDNRTLDIHCDLNVTVSKVSLTGKGVGSLCSVYISGGRNVALKQLANQSSTYVDDDGSYKAPLAVDGNTDGDFDEHSCTHTSDEDDATPTWNLTFVQPQIINRYVLYNREDKYGNRLREFILTSLDQQDRKVFSYNDTSSSNTNVYKFQTAALTSPIWRVSITATHIYENHKPAILTLCEVETYGDSHCDAKGYGKECEHWCNCNIRGEACFVSTGGCPSGCAPGYHGENCNITCSTSYYGVNCEENCSPDCVNQLCNRVTGDCDECSVGRTGPKCEQGCSSKRFGKNCSESCGQNCGGNGTCNPEDGVYSYGCKPGFRDVFCNDTCEHGTYGKDCRYNCSEFCYVNGTTDFTSPCNHITGICTYGCKSGYEDHIECAVVEKQGDDEDSSTSIAVIAGVIIAVLVLVVVIIAVFLLWRRRKSKQNTSKTTGTYVNEVAISQEHRHSGREVDFGSTEELVQLRDLPNNTDQGSSLGYKTPSEMPGTINVESNPGPKGTTGNKKKDVTTPADINYCNTPGGLESTALSVDDLERFMASKEKAFFQQQFSMISSNKSATTLIGLSDKNRHKNRYKNICAYDHSRVTLKVNKKKKQGDYINASYVEGYNAEEMFIASQGPTNVMVEDFVRMLWEQKCEKVVMLTNLIEEGKKKCERYWPEDDEVQFGDIKVVLTTTHVFADYTIRRLQLSKPNAPVQFLTQFHFTAWPDYDVPTSAWGLVDFEQRVASYPTRTPIVVHCSAGIGRTGTLIALRNVMREAEDTGYMDFFTTVQKLRQDRMNMVQTLGQYEFVHRAAQVAMLCMGTTVTASNIDNRMAFLKKNSKSGLSNMEEEFKALCRISQDNENRITEDDEGESVYHSSQSVANKLKNRVSNILPKEDHRVTLTRGAENLGDYINAVFVPSFRKQNQHILTQLPLPTTVLDFWRLITEYNVSLIVAFEQDLQTTDSTIGDYLPGSEEEPLVVPPFTVASQSITSHEGWHEQTIIITTEDRTHLKMSAPGAFEKEQKVTHLTCKAVSCDPAILLTMIKEIRSESLADDRRAVFMCRNGADYSGLVCVLSLLLDRMDNDHRLTVPLVVGAIKAIRPQVIPTLDQYKLLYGILKLYNDTSSVYTNVGEEELMAAGPSTSTSSPAVGSPTENMTIYTNI